MIRGNGGASMRVTPLHPNLGARVEGVDLASMDEATRKAVFDAFQEHSVLVFHDQHLTDESQMAFSERLFGPLETTLKATGKEDRLHPKLVDLSNIDPDHDTQLMGWDDRRMSSQS